MIRIRAKRTPYFFTTVLLIILIYFFVFLHCDLAAKDNASGFVFNSQSEYWPTKGWKTSTPERQGMSSEVLSALFGEIENINKNGKQTSCGWS